MEKILSQQNKSVTVIQAAGRVARKCEGKDAGLVIDIVDRFGMYKGWQKKRISYYKKFDFFIDTMIYCDV